MRMQFDLAYTGMADVRSIYDMDYARVKGLYAMLAEQKKKEKEAMEARARLR